ncbi:MAG: signal recognition particle-docking protein FtsY [Thermodesulfobacteriota bacterium]
MAEESTKKKGFFKRLFGAEESVAAHAEKEAPQPDLTLQAKLREAPASTPEDEGPASARLSQGLKKTRFGFIRRLDEVLLGRKQIDEKAVAELEEVLVTADIGIRTAYELLESVTERVKRKELADPQMLMQHLQRLVEEKLGEVESPLRVGYGAEPFVVMVIGVNGSGKTTTIAKIAARHQAAGRKVLMVAGDTFRAAAVEQMEIWAQRVGCQVVKGKSKADPSSVVFDALERATSENFELVLVDTAGRLHTRVPLMEELKKVRRTVAKRIAEAPHETLLVIDASNGQNAILQAKTFNEAVPVTGIAITKLDGTAKGGCLIGIANELKIPVRYVGVGEKMGDLQDFSAKDFAQALFEIQDD